MSPEDAYVNLKKRVKDRMMKGMSKIIENLQTEFKEAVKGEQIVLSRAEQKRLLKQIVDEFLDEFKE